MSRLADAPQVDHYPELREWARRIAILLKDYDTDYEAEAARTAATLASLTASPGIHGIPIGLGPLPWPGTAAPAKWLFCFGQVLVRATYADLFAVLGTTYNTGGEAGTDFRMPDLRGRAVFGKDNMGGTAANRVTNTGIGNPGVNGTVLGATGGADRHTITLAQLTPHEHPMNRGSGGGLNGLITNANLSDTATNSAGGGEAHPQLPPAIIFNQIIFAGV